MVKKLDILEKYINNEAGASYRNYDPAGMAALAGLGGNPHIGLKCVHIAGTNGKGSVAYMLNAIFSASGLRCGLYVSPHLLEINERIGISGSLISDRELVDYARRMDRLISGSGLAPTFFDILTAIALTFFRDNGCDISVIETGLGGRRDSTSLVVPECSVITEISLDHAHILGDTVEKIAAEKAGIIKEGVPVVTAASALPALEVIRREAAEKNAPFYAVDEHITITDVVKTDAGRVFTLAMPGGVMIRDIFIPLHGEHQVRNAAAAAAAGLIAGGGFRSVTPQTIRAALSSVIVPGRMEILSREPLIIFDPAHNAGAIDSLIRTIHEEYPGSSPVFVISLMADKDYEGIIDRFRSNGIRLFYFNLDDSRARCVSDGEPPFAGVSGSPQEISAALMREEPGGSPIVFCGTFRIYAAARECAEILSRRTGRSAPDSPRMTKNENP